MNKHFRTYRARSVNASKFNLFELILLISCAAVSFALAARGVRMLGVFFMLTVVAFRTAIFDFTLIGGVATLLTMFFGVLSIGMLVLWSAGF